MYWQLDKITSKILNLIQNASKESYKKEQKQTVFTKIRITQLKTMNFLKLLEFFAFADAFSTLSDLVSLS